MSKKNKEISEWLNSLESPINPDDKSVRKSKTGFGGISISRPSLIFYLFLGCSTISLKAEVSPEYLKISKKNNIKKTRGPAQNEISYIPRKTKDICKSVKDKKGLNFENSEKYVLSVLKKSNIINRKSFKKNYNKLHSLLIKNNFIDISSKFRKNFSFNKLRNQSIIILNNSCTKKDMVAIYCNKKYYTMSFVDTKRLEKKINSKNHFCNLGRGTKILVY